MKKYYVLEILCIVLTVCFIIYSVSGTSVRTEKTSEELSVHLIRLMATEDITDRNVNFIRDKYDIDTSLFSSLVCYSSDDVMNVNEIFIGVFADEIDENVLTSFENYAADRYNLYNGYARQQSALIDNYVLKIESGALLFCIDDNAENIFAEFLKIV